MKDEDLIYRRIKEDAKDCIKSVRRAFLVSAGSSQLEIAKTTFNHKGVKSLFVSNNLTRPLLSIKFIEDVISNEELNNHEKSLHVQTHVAQVACGAAAEAFKWAKGNFRTDFHNGIGYLTEAAYHAGLHAGLARGLSQVWFDLSKKNRKHAKIGGEIKKAKYEPIRLKVIELWIAGHPSEIRPWKTATECALTICDYPEIATDERKFRTWIGKYKKKYNLILTSSALNVLPT